MLPILLLNTANIALVAGSVVWGLKMTKPKSSLFRYFTTLSNVFCAFASLAVLVCSAFGALPFWALLLKYAGTAAVSVTMLTVVLFLGPVSHDWKELLSGAQLLLHLVCPLLAIVSFLAFEKTAMPAWVIPIGVAPVLLYGAFYMKKVVYSPEERRWQDFYGFNRGGKWPLSFGLMLLGAAVVALLLWLI